MNNLDLNRWWYIVLLKPSAYLVSFSNISEPSINMYVFIMDKEHEDQMLNNENLDGIMKLSSDNFTSSEQDNIINLIQYNNKLAYAIIENKLNEQNKIKKWNIKN